MPIMYGLCQVPPETVAECRVRQIELKIFPAKFGRRRQTNYSGQG